MTDSDSDAMQQYLSDEENDGYSVFHLQVCLALRRTLVSHS